MNTLRDKLELIYANVWTIPNINIHVCLDGGKCRLFNSEGTVLGSGMCGRMKYIETEAGPYADITIDNHRVVISSEYSKIIHITTQGPNNMCPVPSNSYFKPAKLFMYNRTRTGVRLVDGNCERLSNRLFDEIDSGASNQLIGRTFMLSSKLSIISSSGRVIKTIPNITSALPFLDIFTGRELYAAYSATGRGMNINIVSKRGEILNTISFSTFHTAVVWGGYLLTIETRKDTLYFDGRDMMFKPYTDESIAKAILEKETIKKSEHTRVEL